MNRTAPQRLDFFPPATQNPRIRHLFYILLALILLIVQSVLAPYLAIFSVTPEFLMILGVWIVLSEGQLTGILYGFAIGLLYDLLTFQPLGTDALARMTALFLVGFFADETKTQKNLYSFSFFLFLFFGATIHALLLQILSQLTLQPEIFQWLLTHALSRALYTAFFAIFPWLLITRRFE